MYTELAKLFYSDKENYKRTFETRFNDPEVVRLDFKIGENQAFFLPIPELLRSLAEIRKLDKNIYILKSSLPSVALGQFINRCLVDEIELTNDIEGIRSTRRELNDILADMEIKNTPKRFWGIVHKYSLLIRQETIQLQTCMDIRNIYDELVYAEIAEDDNKNIPDGEIFRKSSTSVTSGTQKEIHRGLYPESKIISSMEKALLILHDEKIDIFFRIAAFHYFFGYIHPFYDGNGRTSRFISSYLLSQELEPLVGYRLSYTVRENLKSYYRAFEVCNNPTSMGDITPFIIMFINIVEESMVLLEEALKRKKGEYDIYCELIPKLHKGGDTKFAKLYNLLIQASLFSDEGISTRKLLKALKISRQTLRNRLKELDSSILVENSISGEKFYHLDITKLSAI